MDRHAPTLTGLALLTLLVFLAAVYPSWALAGVFVEIPKKRFELAWWIAIGFTAVWPVVWYGVVRRPRNGQTTAFQPIRLAGVRRRWVIGEIRQITLKFTNDAYRENFIGRNPEILRAEVVRVK